MRPSLGGCRRDRGAARDAAVLAAAPDRRCRKASSCIRACEKIIADRRAMGEGKLPLDWGLAETLALRDAARRRLRRAPVRPGQSAAARSSIAMRCCTTRTASAGTPGAYIPLQHVKRQAARSCEIIDSVLSEEAVLGFEYGYSTSDPTRSWSGKRSSATS